MCICSFEYVGVLLGSQSLSSFYKIFLVFVGQKKKQKKTLKDLELLKIRSLAFT